jgi:hypothetical protein
LVDLRRGTVLFLNWETRTFHGKAFYEFQIPASDIPDSLSGM